MYHVIPMKITIKHHFKKKHITPQEFLEVFFTTRKITDRNAFLYPPNPADITLDTFFPKSQCLRAFDLLKNIWERKETVVVYTDYDADGITGGAILWETLHLLGFHAMPYVPHRVHEGYGFSKKGIDAVKKLYNPRLIISVDHGISAAEKIAYAHSVGIGVIVTDHHVKPAHFSSKAHAVFHTEKLSGAGVAYFFAKELFQYFKNERLVPKETLTILTDHFSSDYILLASIGGIADLVPLQGATRSLVKHGLLAFARTRRKGIIHLLREAGILGKVMTPYDIGFIIAPRINAVGRLEHAIDALRLLCTKQDEKALQLAQKVGQKNRERQVLVEDALEEAKKIVEGEKTRTKKLSKVIILTSHTWNEGIIGLIAAKITEEYYRPTLVITMADGFAKGSARSIHGFDITAFLKKHQKFLIDVGGHKAAAGFTIKKNNIEPFKKALVRAADTMLQDKDLKPTIDIDFSIPLSSLTISLVKSIEGLQPFGVGNPQPTFYSEGVVMGAGLFGKDNNHLKIVVSDHEDRYSSSSLEVIFFKRADVFLTLSKGQKVAVVYTLEIDRWGGRERLRGKGKVIIVNKEAT